MLQIDRIILQVVKMVQLKIYKDLVQEYPVYHLLVTEKIPNEVLFLNKIKF
jgi:hypothetical protein